MRDGWQLGVLRFGKEDKYREEAENEAERNQEVM